MADVVQSPSRSTSNGKSKGGSIKRQTPLKKSTKRPKIRRSDTSMVDDSSGDEYFDTLSCQQLSSSDPAAALANHKFGSWKARRKTLPLEPGKLIPPIAKSKGRKSHSMEDWKKETIQKFQEETKLVVIEYLSQLSPDELRARNRHVVKAKTIQFGEKPSYLPIKRSDSDLKRSTSDVGSYRDGVRKKLQTMAVPLKRMRSVSPTLLREIEGFDKSELKRKRRESLSKLPLDRITDEDRQTDVPSPETKVVQKLEWMSSEILQEFPKLLEGPLCELLTPLDSGRELTYDTFSGIAKGIFNKQISGKGAMWSRVALIFYLVREVVLMEHMNDTQLELLVEYASKFVAENMYDWLTKNNSLEKLKLEEDVLNATGSLFDSIDSDTDTSDEWSQPDQNEQSAMKNRITGVVNEWVTYGVAVLAVGLGIAYNYFKS